MVLTEDIGKASLNQLHVSALRGMHPRREQVCNQQSVVLAGNQLVGYRRAPSRGPSEGATRQPNLEGLLTTLLCQVNDLER